MKALFSGRRVEERLKENINSISQEIGKLPKSSFENTTIDELATRFIEQNSFKVPKLLEDKIYTKKPQDIKIKISTGRGGYGLGGKTTDGTKFTFVTPFDGDSYFFELLPSKHQNVFPSSDISGNELIVTIDVPVGGDTSGIRAEFDKNLERIKTYLGFLEDDAKIFHNSLPSILKGNLQSRKNKLDNDDDAANSFGFPVR